MQRHRAQYVLNFAEKVFNTWRSASRPGTLKLITQGINLQGFVVTGPLCSFSGRHANLLRIQ
jgi:hypothetical protein